MAKFTSIEKLLEEAYQSIVGSPPEHGRVELGTKTLDNRDYWENINFNKDTFQPYLTGNLETLNTELRDGIVYRRNIETSELFQYSIDALPFVTDINDDDEIIRLDEYYDKRNDSTQYYLATEGKINYYLYARESGRPTPDGHIDNYATRNKTNKFDSYANRPGETGFYLFKLNWGDGTTIEYTDRPKLLEESVLLEHFYEKPGFYTISGVVYALFKPNDGTGREAIGGYERFETNILLNPSKNYELNLYDYYNFATIGGVDLNSSLIKSSLNTIGIDPKNPFEPHPGDDDSENIEKLNLFDKLQLFNFLNKVSDTFLSRFDSLVEPYSEAFDNTPNITDDIFPFQLNVISEPVYNRDTSEFEIAGTIIVSPDTDDGTGTGDRIYDEGTVVNIQALADDRFEFDTWDVTIGNDSQIGNLSSPSTTVTMSRDIRVYARFKAVEFEDFDGEDFNPDSDFDDPIDETTDIDIDNYVFPFDEYFGEPRENEIFTDSNGVTWQYTHLTNEQAGIILSEPLELTNPAQFDWLVVGV
tara:strand:+ start:1943 stop:3532 length:1590 start_codon:yes stop_codon:yes gene_type:complete